MTAATGRATTSLAKARVLDLESFARAARLHPDVVRRFVALGLLEPVKGTASELSFPSAQLAAVARLQRLRAGFGLNYAALGLVVHLLDRIEELERALRQRGATRAEHQRTGGRSWT